MRRHRLQGVKVRLALGAGSCLEARALDLGAIHEFREKDPVAQKELMVVTARICTARQALESVQVELTLKGSQLALTKVSVDKRNNNITYSELLEIGTDDS